MVGGRPWIPQARRTRWLPKSPHAYSRDRPVGCRRSGPHGDPRGLTLRVHASEHACGRREAVCRDPGGDGQGDDSLRNETEQSAASRSLGLVGADLNLIIKAVSLGAGRTSVPLAHRTKAGSLGR